MLAHPMKLRPINADTVEGYRDRPKMSRQNHKVPRVQPQVHIINPTNPGRAFDNGVEHRLHVRRRPTDDAEHFRGCRLMCQRLTQLCVALLDFFEQPDVFDGDDRLIGEGFDESDFFFDERINYRSTYENCSNRNTFAHERDSKLGSITFSYSAILNEARKLSRSHRQQILNMNWLALDNGSTRY